MGTLVTIEICDLQGFARREAGEVPREMPLNPLACGTCLKSTCNINVRSEVPACDDRTLQGDVRGR